eukprot:CAMPEP_0116921908 /NCGR_PEP_ID=MMETSP0467-20121206/21930_1 /TAXON_ID=283647 /ORGANISM="Mesodinium pulex, Strain SPMC105" /LENGTH=116 /DNA_ID=CAMNT_0004600105 /DNA_START=148 /DNA_END=498 /DNA_ORIENTATION=+
MPQIVMASAFDTFEHHITSTRTTPSTSTRISKPLSDLQAHRVGHDFVFLAMDDQYSVVQSLDLIAPVVEQQAGQQVEQPGLERKLLLDQRQNGSLGGNQDHFVLVHRLVGFQPEVR